MGRTPALIALLIAGCDDGASSRRDAEPSDSSLVGDAGPDADLVNYQFTGTYLDWDSTAAAPCPIAGATWLATYDTSRVAMTDADGVFTIPLASYTPLLEIAEPSAPSTCATPSSTYTIPGIAIATPAVFFSGGAFVARTLTSARVTTFYATFGATFDATRAGLLVHVNGAQRAVSISDAHAAVQAFDGTTWAAGPMGLDVYFPNIDLSDNDITTVTYSGGARGLGSVPLAAGSITYMAVIAD